MDKLISVIVPVYNVSEYLPRCLDSIINQTYRNLEIILVDDGSTDNSGQICDEYAKKDNRIIVIHKENGGVSSARNQGIDKATGEYIGFVDSDDVVEENMYSILIDNAENKNVEISCCQIQTKSVDGSISNIDTFESKVFKKQEIIEGFFSNQRIRGFIVSPCNKIIKKNIIGSLRFKNYALAEDFLFIFEVLNNCQYVHYDSTVGYYYLHRENSAMTSKFSEKRFDYIYAIEEIAQHAMKQYDISIQNKANFWVFEQVLVNYRSMIINKMQKNYPDKSNEYRKYLKENRSLFKRLNGKRKIDYIFSLYSPFIYNFIR